MLKHITSVLIIVVIVLTLIPAPLSFAQDEIIGTTSGELNVRTAPGADNAKVGLLGVQDEVVVEGRNQIGDWILIRTPDSSLRGWVASRFVFLPVGVNVQSLGVVDEVVAAPAANAPAANTGDASQPNVGDVVESLPNSGTYAIPAAANADPATMTAQLEATPILHNMGSGSIRSIYARGQALGNRPNVFTRVGDSITANQPFLRGFGNAGSYDLGGYDYLQSTIDFFSEAPRAGFPNSWDYTSFSARSAFNGAAVLDRIWTDPNFCDPDTEAPLQCEYRVIRPAVAVIMLGSVDVQIYDLQSYTDFLNRIVEITIDQGVVPILTTFPLAEDYLYYEQSLRFNMVVLDIANSRGLPLINLWQATRPLPNRGMDADRYHLSQGSTFYRFDGSENEWGVTLRNLLTLQALHEVRINIPL